MSGVRFEVVGSLPGSGLRAGLLHTPHGTVRTPSFMPVGTLGTVKALTPEDVRGTGAQIVLSNSYHLSLQPGIETVQRLGGLHAFMRWDGPILTDSGGFQVFSLDALREVSDAGVTFASHLDGTPMFLSPECVVESQERLGADLIMPLDECLGPMQAAEAEESALGAHAALVAAQPGRSPPRRPGAVRLDPGRAVRGLTARGGARRGRRTGAGLRDRRTERGRTKGTHRRAVAGHAGGASPRPARYLMGVGHPKDLADYARLGVDLFDCVLPTRLGRTGSVWSDLEGNRLHLSRRALLEQAGPIMAGCACLACTGWSVGSLAALFQSRALLAYRLASIHNLAVLGTLASDLRRTVVYTT